MEGEATRARDAGRRPMSALREIAISTGPILRREFVGLLRSRKGFWITVLTVAGTSLFPLLAWPEEGSPMPFQRAHQAFGAYQVTAFIAIFLFVPVVAGSSVTSERERGTYEMLFLAIPRPAGIVLGKLLASSLFFVLLLALTFPMICVLYLLGGFEVQDFLFSLGFAALAVFFLAMIGLNASLKYPKTSQAVTQAFGEVFVLLIFCAFCVGLFALPVVFIWSAVSLFRKARTANPSFRPSRPSQVLADPFTRGAGAPARRVPRTLLTKAFLELVRDGIPDRWNPLFVATVMKDTPGNASARRTIFWGMGAILLILSVTEYASGVHVERFGAPINTIILPLFLIFPGLAVEAMLSEREDGILELLRTTLLIPAEVLGGKLLAALFGGAGLLAVAMAIQLYLAVLSNDSYYLLLFAPEMSTAVLAASVGLLGATVARRMISSLVLSYALALWLLFALENLLESFARGPGTFFGFAALALALSGVCFALSVAAYRRLWMRDR